MVGEKKKTEKNFVMYARTTLIEYVIVKLPIMLCLLQAMLVVGFASSLDSEMAAGLLYVICVPGGGLGYLVATLQSSAASRTISATVNLMSTYLVIRKISPLYVQWAAKK